MEIRACAVKEKGGSAEPFVYERSVGSHDVLVRITHCSVARGDIQCIDDDWGDTRFPVVPGHEVVGIVEETGSGVAGLQKGDRVGVGYQHEACFECAHCRRGAEQFCPGQKVVAVDTFGGFAEHLVVDSRFAFPLPTQLDSAPSAPLLSSGLTVYAGIVHAQLAERSRVAVIGIGGLGHLAVQFLTRMGHRVAAFSRSPGKREVIERLGGEYVDGSDATTLMAHRGAFDFVLSTLNVTFDIDACTRMLKPEGQLCLVASPLEPVPLNPGLLYDHARRRIYGNYVGSRADAIAMLAFAAVHRIGAAVEIMPFSQVNRAIERVRRRDVAAGLVLESRGGSGWPDR